MARVKNAGGGLGDEDPRRPPRWPANPKGKATKKLATRKHKYSNADTARAAVVVEAAERAEREGARSGVVIADQLSPEARARLERIECLHGGPPGTLMMGGRCVAIEEPQPQGESHELDVSGIDWTLGGSVRSLPPERLVNRNCAAYELPSSFLIQLVGDPFLI